MSSSSSKTEVTDEERGLAEVGAAKWNDYQQRFVPVENQVMEQIRSTPSQANKVAGVANADVWQQAQVPSTDTSLKGLVSAYDRQGSILANAVPKAAESTHDTQMQGMLKMAAYGRGLSDQASLGLYKAGANATQEAIAAAKAQDQSNNMWGEIGGTAAGAGMRGLLSRYGGK